MKNFTITKRDGSKDRFSLDKIMNAILKAFESVNEPTDLGTLSKIIANLDIKNDIKVEDIQNQVELALMKEGYYQVAKSFIVYRQQHTEDRETLEKMKFLSDYCVASNAATGSKFDANANVEHKNIATLIGELPKQGFIRLNRRLLVDRIKKMYGKDLADEYIDLLNHHFIYKNDETNLANYCASITMYPWLIGGTNSIGGNSTAPTNLKSFCGGFINMVFMVSSMLAGACATPEFLMYMNYFIQKEYGKDYWERADEIVDLSLRKRTIDKVITDYFEQREQLVSAFVLVDIRHEPQKIDVEFMQWLGERAIPFAIIFTKADKLKPQAIERNVAAYKEALLEWWEEFPPYFVTSAQNKTGKEELTQYIEQTNQTIING